MCNDNIFDYILHSLNANNIQMLNILTKDKITRARGIIIKPSKSLLIFLNIS